MLVDVSGPRMLPHAFLPFTRRGGSESHVTHGEGDLKVEVGAGALRAHDVNAQGASGPFQIVPVILAFPEFEVERQQGTGVNITSERKRLEAPAFRRCG